MCFGGSKSQPVPPAAPAPVADTAVREKAARSSASRTGAAAVKAKGRKSTILTGQEGVTEEAELSKKTILGG